MLYIFTGPVKSGKSLNMLEFADNRQALGQNVHYFCPEADTRSRGFIRSRAGKEHIAKSVSSFDHLLSYYGTYPDLLVVDEIHLLANQQTLPHHLLSLSRYIDIAIAFPNRTWQGKNFPVLSSLFGMPGVVTKLFRAKCCQCGLAADFSWLIKPQENKDIVVDDGTMYEPVCHEHWQKVSNVHSL